MDRNGAVLESNQRKYIKTASDLSLQLLFGLKNKVENLEQVKGEDGIASAKPDYSFNTLIRKKYWGSDVVIVLR